MPEPVTPEGVAAALAEAGVDGALLRRMAAALVNPEDVRMDAALFAGLVALAEALPPTAMVSTPVGPMSESEVIAHLRGLDLQFAREAVAADPWPGDEVKS